MSKHIIREQRRIENKRRMVLLVFAIACLVGLVLDVMTGPSMLPVRDVIEALLRLSGVEDTTHTIIYDLRLPIALMALLVGASLGAGGAEMQTLLNNPMASPYTLGLAAAAGFGASLVIAFGGFGLPLQYAVPIGAFAMTMLASAVLFLFASLKQFAAATLILVGIALLFIFQSLLSLVQFIASPEVSQQILFWLFGNLNKATWTNLAVVAVVSTVCITLLMRDGWQLTALRLGEERAAALGVNLTRLRIRTLILVAMMTDRGTFSLEKTLAMKPDVVVLAKWQYDTLKAEIPRFEAANIPVVVVDYNDQSVANHTNSTKIFGQIAGTEQRANQAAQEYADGIADIQKRVEAAGTAKPKIYIEFGDKGPQEHSFTFGKNMWGAIADTVGGENISKPFVENWGPINPEQLLVNKPDVIIISGTEVGMKQTDAMAMGIDISADEAQRRLKGFTTRNGWENLPAVKNNRVYGIYHTASRSLSDLASAQFMAKTLYPEAFKDVDPEKTYTEFHEKYLPVKPSGTFFIQLGCGASLCKDKASAVEQAAPTEAAPQTLSWWDKLVNWLRHLFT